MKLSKLKEMVDRAIEHAKECGQSPDEIGVSLQIDIDSIWTSNDIEVYYDNDAQASGCVIVGQK